MGTGGIGGYFGGLLAKAGHDVTVVARGAHLGALQANGLTVETTEGRAFTTPVTALSEIGPGASVDLILVTVKSYDIDEAIETIAPGVSEDTLLLTLMNGVDSGEQLAKRFGPERVLDGLVYIESFIKSPGVVAQVGGSRLVVFGNRNGANSQRETRFLQTFESAGWNVELSPTILGMLWRKLSFIGPLAALNTLTGLSSAVLCSSDECLTLIHDVTSEYVAVANADGAALPNELADTMAERMRGFSGTTSMLRDRIGGKRLETDAMVTSVVRRGRELGVPTPTTQTIDRLLAPMRKGGAQRLG
jgi:2-dehydropantoate 2-reductase